MGYGLRLSLLDKKILNRLQQDIPFETSPWRKISRELNIEEPALLKRIDFLKKKGIIRRISATFNPRKIGFISTLAAVKVAPENIDNVAQAISLYPEVTHNYKRDAEYNIWFTLVAKNRKRISQVISQLKKNKKIDSILELPANKLFKIDVNFKV